MVAHPSPWDQFGPKSDVILVRRQYAHAMLLHICILKAACRGQLPDWRTVNYDAYEKGFEEYERLFPLLEDAKDIPMLEE